MLLFSNFEDLLHLSIVNHVYFICSSIGTKVKYEIDTNPDVLVIQRISQYENNMIEYWTCFPICILYTFLIDRMCIFCETFNIDFYKNDDTDTDRIL